MKILETERLILREINDADAPFVLDLLNQPSFVKYIGDRNVRSIEQAREYIETRFAESYKQFGFGLWAVELKENGTLIGNCGFVKRETLPEPDIGFAFLPQFGGKGYAVEAARACLNYGRAVLKLNRVLAITTQDNRSSIRLLEKIGFRFERLIEMPTNETLNLFSSEK